MTLGAECLYASLGRGVETTKQEIDDVESEEGDVDVKVRKGLEYIAAIVIPKVAACLSDNPCEDGMYRKSKQHCQVEWLAAFYDEHEVDEDKGNTDRKKYSPKQVQKPLLL